MPFDTTYNALEGNYYFLSTAPPATVSLSSDFMAGFESGDLRRIKWIGEIKDSGNKSYYYPFKYKQRTNTASTLEYSAVMRVEELYLIRAEAYIEKSNITLGLADLNKLRDRVSLPPITTNDKNTLLETILRERRYELFTEFGNRFYDLKHFAQLHQKMATLKTGWKNFFDLLPVPEKELLINPNLYPLNNGF